MTRTKINGPEWWPAWLVGRERRLMRAHLRGFETLIRNELANPRLRARPERRHALTGALTEIKRAQDELVRCPEGARLAIVVSQAAAWYAALDLESRRKGAATTNADRQPRIEQRNAGLRSYAGTLNPRLSLSAKARRVRAQFPSLRLSDRQLRRVLAK